MKFDTGGSIIFLMASILRNSLINDCIFSYYFALSLAACCVYNHNQQYCCCICFCLLEDDCMNHRNEDIYQVGAEIVSDNYICLLASSGLLPFECIILSGELKAITKASDY